MAVDRRRCSVSSLSFLTLALAGACTATTETDDIVLEEVPALTAVADLRIGSVDDPDLGFSAVFRATVDRDGRIYVLDGLDMQIRVFTPDGSALHRIGRRGEGPGEFQRMSRFGVVGDTVWTFDSAGDRLALFDRNGTLLSTARSEPYRVGLWGGGFGHVLPDRMRPDGLFTSTLGRVSSSRNDPAPDVEATASIPIPRILFDATGAIVDTVGWDPSPPPRMARPPSQQVDVPFFTEIGGRPHPVPQPPTELPAWANMLDGRVVVDVPHPTSEVASFTITRVSLPGDTVYHRVVHYTASRYTDDDLDALAAAGAAGPFGATGAPVDPAVAPQLRAAMEFPDFRPATMGPIPDADDRLWIQRDQPEGPSRTWVVFGVDGLPVGQLELPPTFMMLWSQGDAFLGTERDEFDVPWVVRYRMEM